MGEPAGIGAELTLMAWSRRHESDVPPFFCLDDPERLAALAQGLRMAVPIARLEAPEAAAAAFATALPVLAEPLPAAVEPGRPDAANGAAVLRSIARGATLAQAGRAVALVTNPIHKALLYEAGFRHPGHTEYLGELAARNGAWSGRPVMMLACPGLRVVPVTVHLPLRRAVCELSRAAIMAAGRVTAAALRGDFAIARPRLAVAGLNPHAGEAGALGREELEVIGPAVAALRGEGLEVAGPAPADSLFHPAARAGYDAALCMYHDQALIPLKTIDFAGGVNVTLGLPFVRTSPDHGTALDIAGTGRADPSSLLAALAMARDIAANRARMTA